MLCFNLRTIFESKYQSAILKYCYLIDCRYPQPFIKLRQQFFSLGKFQNKFANQITLSKTFLFLFLQGKRLLFQFLIPFHQCVIVCIVFILILNGLTVFHNVFSSQFRNGLHLLQNCLMLFIYFSAIRKQILHHSAIFKNLIMILKQLITSRSVAGLPEFTEKEE